MFPNHTSFDVVALRSRDMLAVAARERLAHAAARRSSAYRPTPLPSAHDVAGRLCAALVPLVAVARAVRHGLV